MRWNEITEDGPFQNSIQQPKSNDDPNSHLLDDKAEVLGYKVPDWSVDEDLVAIFENTMGFNCAQVFKASNGKYVADFGKGDVKEFRYVGQLETVLKSKKMTRFNRIEYYRPSAY